MIPTIPFRTAAIAGGVLGGGFFASLALEPVIEAAFPGWGLVGILVPAAVSAIILMLFAPIC